MNTPAKIFISYTQDDVEYKRQLQAHLSGLKRNNMIADWADDEMLIGKVWDQEKKQRLQEADIILFLVSASFLASNFESDKEMQTAMSRYHAGQVIIVPILIRPCDIESLEISKFKILPQNKLPISKWKDKDEAYVDIVKQLRRIIGNIELANNDIVILEDEDILTKDDQIMNMSEEELSYYKDFIANNETKEILIQLTQKTANTSFQHEIILLNGAFTDLKDKEIEGTINSEDFKVGINKIHKSILNLLDKWAN